MPAILSSVVCTVLATSGGARPREFTPFMMLGGTGWRGRKERANEDDNRRRNLCVGEKAQRSRQSKEYVCTLLIRFIIVKQTGPKNKIGETLQKCSNAVKPIAKFQVPDFEYLS